MGVKGIKIFQRAPLIERVLSHAPLNLEEVYKAEAELTYTREQENPEMASLFAKYYKAEELFNACLGVKIKKNDLLPKDSIDGSTVKHPGYHLVKLPIDDPRAFILGDITHCCQSIGRHGSRCVIDGVMSEHNGFYVLLKEKKNTLGGRFPLIDAKINYKSYDIVGQGYAWLSKTGNLVFDSWENLTPSVEDKVIVPLLQEFGRVITKPKDSTILRITIGTGGKTPHSFNGRVEPESMTAGHMYGDAINQFLVFINQEKVNYYQERIQKIFGQDYKVNITSIQQAKSLEALFMDGNNASFYIEKLGKNKYEELFKLSVGNQLFLNVVSLLHQNKLLTLENLELLIHYIAHVEVILINMELLENNINDPSFKLIVSNSPYQNFISFTLCMLGDEDKSLLTEENCKRLAVDPENCVNIADEIISKAKKQKSSVMKGYSHEGFYGKKAPQSNEGEEENISRKPPL